PVCRPYLCVCCVVFTATASTEIYTLSLHDALPISAGSSSDCVSTTVVPWGPLATSTSSTIACMSCSPRRPVANGGGMAGSGGGVKPGPRSDTVTRARPPATSMATVNVPPSPSTPALLHPSATASSSRSTASVACASTPSA